MVTSSLGIWILAIQSTEDGEIKLKACYVICGNRDKQNKMLLHAARALQLAPFAFCWPSLHFMVLMCGNMMFARPTFNLQYL